MPPGQADGLGELLVDVDRVEVPGRARVADREVLVGRDAQRLELVARLQGHQTARTMFVQRPTQTVSPRWLTDVDSKTKKPLPARSVTSVTPSSS